MNKITKTMVTILIAITLLTACGGNKVELTYVSTKGFRVEYTPIHYAWEYTGDQSNSLPVKNEEYTAFFNNIMDEMFKYTHDRFDLDDFTLSEVPVIILTPQQCEQILAMEAQDVKSMEAMYNSYYRAVFMTDAFVTGKTRDQIIGVFAHETIHPIFQQYNGKKDSVFCKTKGNGLLGFYLSEGFAQDISNDFLEKYYPEARKVRHEVYGFTAYVADFLSQTINAEELYLKNDVEAFEKAFNKIIYSNTNAISKGKKFTPFEYYLYQIDYACSLWLHTYSLDDIAEEIKREKAVWELTFLTGRDYSDKDHLVQIFRTYDKMVNEELFCLDEFDSYLRSLIKN